MTFLIIGKNVLIIRMQEAMKVLKTNSQPSNLIEVLLGIRSPQYSGNIVVEWIDKGLNESQKDAVNFALQSEHVALIHGPPGTGKTHTCVEIINQLVKRKEKVLVCGPSNVAVDNLVERLGKAHLNIVRLGIKILSYIRTSGSYSRIGSYVCARYSY